MATRIRLSRHGKKKQPFYHIVVADSRNSRDGKYIEKIGHYDPNTKPDTLEVNMEKALIWLGNGALPSETTRTLLSRAGVMLRKHLARGVQKNVITTEEADKRFNKWVTENQAKRESFIKTLSQKEKDRIDKQHEGEKKARQKKAEKIQARLAAEVKLAETPTETLTETNKDVPPEIRAETPVETPAEIQIPVDTHVETPATDVAVVQEPVVPKTE